MQLIHDFTVVAAVDDVWSALTDVQTVAACMPGAAITAVDGDTFEGRVRVRVGPMTLTYTGTGRQVSRDDTARSLTITADGREARGQGTAQATIRVEVPDGDADHTTVRVSTDLDVTGRPAQFGRGALKEIGDKLLTRFADELAARLADEGPAGAEEDVEAGAAGTGGTRGRAGQDARGTGRSATSAGARGTDAPDDEALDLVSLAGGTIARRVVPLALAALAGAVLTSRLRRRG